MLTAQGEHKGKRCFVIGSGPSVRQMDLRWLKDEITIGVNESYKALPFTPTYMAIGDRALWAHVRDAYAGMNTKVICTTGTNGTVGSGYKGNNLVSVRTLADRKFTIADSGFVWDMTKKANLGWNVIPEVVLPFVCWAGFDVCYLIGCDCTNSGYSYEKSSRPGFQKIDDRAQGSYKQIAKTKLPTKIINAGVGGKLDAFPRKDFSNLRPLRVVGFYTPDKDYRKLAEHMAQSVEAQGLTCTVRERPSLAKAGMKAPLPWAMNCSQCGPFLREMRDEFPLDDLLYLDADAVMVRYPHLFFDFPRNYDFAVPFITAGKAVHQLSSNTLYFAASENATRLLDKWCEEQEKRNIVTLKSHFKPPFFAMWDQNTLQDVLLRVPGLRWIELPWEYGKITPTPKGEELMPSVDPEQIVIEQYQASRWNKYTLQGGPK